MREPLPENIDGQVTQHHEFKHEINWGYVALAVVLVFAVLQLNEMYADSDDENELF